MALFSHGLESDIHIALARDVAQIAQQEIGRLAVRIEHRRIGFKLVSAYWLGRNIHMTVEFGFTPDTGIIILIIAIFPSFPFFHFVPFWWWGG